MSEISIDDLFRSIGFYHTEISAELSGRDDPLITVKGYFYPQKATKKNGYIPRRILKSGNRTIVFWADGTKTIVKRADDEAESDYAAFTAALGIKLYGSNSALKRIVERTETQKPKGQKKPKTNVNFERAVSEAINEASGTSLKLATERRKAWERRNEKKTQKGGTDHGENETTL